MKNKQVNKSSVFFSDSATNVIIYCYYLMATIEESTKEEEKVGDENQDNDLISLRPFESIELLIRRIYSPLLLLFHILLCPYGPVYRLRGKVIGYGVREQATASVTINRF